MQQPPENPVDSVYANYRKDKQEQAREKAQLAAKIGWGSDYSYVFVPVFFRFIAGFAFISSPFVLVAATEFFVAVMILGVVAAAADILVQTSARSAEALTKIVESQSRKKSA